MKQDTKEMLIQLNNEFSASNLTEVLVQSGVLHNGIMPEEVDFGRFIFLQSNSDEIYSSLERQFIQKVSCIYLYPEYMKSVSRGSMKCRVVCVDLSQIGNGIYDAILFMKIMSKATEGWMFFVIKLDDGIHLGMRVFDRDETENCALCESEDSEIILDEMIWSESKVDFISYYAFMYESIFPKNKTLSDYDEMAVMRYGIQYDYLESLRDIEKSYGVSLAAEVDRYICSFDEIKSYSFYMEYLDTMEALKSIKSSKVNTLEMLFEADELEKIAKKNEQVYQQSLDSPVEERSMDEDVINRFGDDPEAMIKLLKEKRGIL